MWLEKNKSILLDILITALIWLAFLIIIPLGWNANLPMEFWAKQGIFMIVMVTTHFLNSLILVPRLLLEHKTFGYFTCMALGMVMVLTTTQAADYWLGIPEILHNAFRPEVPFVEPESWFRFDWFTFLTVMLVFGISTSITLVKNRQKEKEDRQLFEKEKIRSELATLKSQINPHFYFNTLNNIYALTDLDPEKAKQAIHMLSKMMRYVLYESQKREVPISKEFEFIQNYIQLMKLRFPSSANILFTKPDTGSLRDQLIAPMILMPFVENAFKHGVNHLQQCKIEISISQADDGMRMVVTNGIYKTNGLDIEQNSGIGLTNTRRRLELIYPESHQLEINQTEDQYTVELKLNMEE